MMDARYEELVTRGLYQFDKEALFELGEMCRDGVRVEKDLSAAEEWFEKARMLGHADAEKVLAELRGEPPAELEEPDAIPEKPPEVKEVPEEAVVEEILEEEPEIRLSEEEFHFIRFDSTDADEVRSLIESKKADVNAQDSKGSLLHYVSSAKVAEVLVDMGTDVNARNEDGKVPLHCCMNEDVAIVLIVSGAHVNARDEEGATPLHDCREGKQAKVLVEEGAALDPHDVNGETALMKAAVNGRLEVAKILIDRGANLGAKNKDGMTALDFAEKNERTSDTNYQEQSRNCEKIAVYIRDRLKEKGKAEEKSSKGVKTCPNGHGPLKAWEGRLRCWTCGYVNDGVLTKAVWARGAKGESDAHQASHCPSGHGRMIAWYGTYRCTTCGHVAGDKMDPTRDKLPKENNQGIGSDSLGCVWWGLVIFFILWGSCGG